MCTGTLQVNGADANGTNAGGGSGGTMAITTPELVGSGKIEANGGQGKGDGGGGAGGRIAISITTKYVVVVNWVVVMRNCNVLLLFLAVIPSSWNCVF